MDAPQQKQLVTYFYGRPSLEPAEKTLHSGSRGREEGTVPRDIQDTGYRDTGIQGYRDTGIQGYMNTIVANDDRVK